MHKALKGKGEYYGKPHTDYTHRIVPQNADREQPGRKQICIGLLLVATRQYSDLESCEYIKDAHDDEWVIITGQPNEAGYRWKYKVNVTWDSGIAMILDVMRKLG